MSAQSVPCCNTNECAIYCLMQVHNLLLDATQSVVCDVHEHTICCFLPHKFAICNTNFPIFPRLWPKMPFSLKTFLTCRNAPQLSQSFPTFLKTAKKHGFHRPGAYLSSGLAQSLGLQVHLFTLGLSLLGGGGVAFLFLIIIHSRHRPQRCLWCFLLGRRSFGRKLPTGLLQQRHDLVFGGRL